MEEWNNVLDDHNIRGQIAEQHSIHLLVRMLGGMKENLDVGFMKDGV